MVYVTICYTEISSQSSQVLFFSLVISKYIHTYNMTLLQFILLVVDNCNYDQMVRYEFYLWSLLVILSTSDHLISYVPIKFFFLIYEKSGQVSRHMPIITCWPQTFILQHCQAGSRGSGVEITGTWDRSSPGWAGIWPDENYPKTSHSVPEQV